MPTSLTHIAMHVQDLAACVDFYHRYAEMNIVHERPHHNGKVIWMAEHGREKEFILVLLPGGPGRAQSDSDFSHLGFAVASRHAVDSIADRARAEGILVWETREEDYPVGSTAVCEIPTVTLSNLVTASHWGRVLKIGSFKCD